MKLLAIILMLIPSVAFGETITYICDYSSYSDVEGNHKVKEKFVLNFIVDSKTEKGYLLGNQGSSEVTVLQTEDKISFLEVTGTGNLMTTAIDSKSNSVHSRNTVILGDLMPSQYYGKCQIK